MLPQPSASFTLPSLYDDLELDCRLYFPRASKDDGQIRCSGCAIFAHPYAPLGGSYDDPVVHSVGSLLMQRGFVLTTFNFRGAEGSGGKTSWSAFMNVLGVSEYMTNTRGPVLLLGGYSYGSMIAAHLPDITMVPSILHHATAGSSEHEIADRADGLAKAFLGYCETQQERGRSPRKVSGAQNLAATTIGGYDSADASRRISRDGSHRIVDKEKVRQSMDRVRQKLGGRGHSHESQGPAGVTETEKPPVMPEVAFLLISPLLGPISSFATMFSKLKFDRKTASLSGSKAIKTAGSEELLSGHASLVVFGSDDHFTSSRKVRQWCEGLKARAGSRLDFQEIEHAGHFWHDQEPESQMKSAVAKWLTSIL